MARINIEDRLFTDPRFAVLEILLSSKELAVGKLVLAWRMAQDYHLKGEVIPKEVFEMLGFGVLEKAKFAVPKDDGFYMVGSEESFQWLEVKRESGKKGGLAKASKALAKASIPLASASEILANARKTVAKASITSEVLEQTPSESYPLTLTPTLTLLDKKEESFQGLKPDAVIKLFNSILAGRGRIEPFKAYYMPALMLNDFVTTSGSMELRNINQWEDYFKLVATRKKLLSYPATLKFLVNHDNAIEILSGGYQEQVAVSPYLKPPANKGRDMATKIYSQVLQNGMHGLKETLKSLEPIEVRALEKFGLASEIISCPSDFAATDIKNRLKIACEQVIQEQAVAS